MSVDHAHCNSFGVKPADANDRIVNCIADTQAQSSLCLLKQCKEMGCTDPDVISALSAANKSRVGINGIV